jgi:outer membrane protein TolC
MRERILLSLVALALPQAVFSQLARQTVDLRTALDLARKNNPAFQSAVIGSRLAAEDRKQAKGALLPSLNYLNQFIYTEGDGQRASGVFVANDGIHVYNSQGVVHEDLSFAKRSDYLRTVAAEAAALAKQEIASRGLNAAVTQAYYSLALATRKTANARKSLEEASQFADLTAKQEQGGEVARADVVKSQLTQEQRRRDLQDTELAEQKARIALAVVIFPDYRQDFDILDDLEQPPVLAALAEVRALAGQNNPDIRAAEAALKQEEYGLASARGGYLPSLSMDFFYGIDANQFAVYAPDHIRNLGYSAQASLIIPLWNWGTTASKVRQANLKTEQAKLEVTFAQRQLLANLDSFYRDAESAQLQVGSLKHSLDLAAESLKLTLLRYQAGEATALEVTDAQATLTQARNGYDDGLSRYRLSLAALQTLTGI